MLFRERTVGRVTPCAPRLQGKRMVYIASNGAHGVTRPTNAEKYALVFFHALREIRRVQRLPSLLVFKALCSAAALEHTAHQVNHESEREAMDWFVKW